MSRFSKEQNQSNNCLDLFVNNSVLILGTSAIVFGYSIMTAGILDFFGLKLDAAFHAFKNNFPNLINHAILNVDAMSASIKCGSGVGTVSFGKAVFNSARKNKLLNQN